MNHKKNFFLKNDEEKNFVNNLTRTTRCTRFQKDHPRVVRVRREKFPKFCRTLLTVNISEMADKEKRLRKILSKKGWKGRLKSVATLEQSHCVLVHIKELGKLLFIKKEIYLELIERGHTFPEEEVYFVVSSDPSSEHIVQRYLAHGFSYYKTQT